MKQKNIFSSLKRIIIFFLLLLLFSSICAIKYINTVSAHISDSVLRLHVVANSDSKIDQNLKYLVRDRLIEYMNTLTVNCSSKQDAICLAKEHLHDFENIARDVVLENGFDYAVLVELR